MSFRVPRSPLADRCSSQIRGIMGGRGFILREIHVSNQGERWRSQRGPLFGTGDLQSQWSENTDCYRGGDQCPFR